MNETMKTAAAGIDAVQVLRRSRVAGFWYLALAVLSPLNLLFIPAKLISSGDAAATAAAIWGSERLFRLGMVTGIAGQIAFLIAALAFYDLFKSIDKRQARILLTLVVASVPISILNALNQVAVLLLSDGAGSLGVFTQQQREAAVLFFLELFDGGFHLAGFFWGLWLLPLGILVLKSGFFPKVFGVLLLLGFGGYAINSAVVFLFPEFVEPLAPFVAFAEIVGEVPFLFWLLIRGARPRPSVRSNA